MFKQIWEYYISNYIIKNLGVGSNWYTILTCVSSLICLFFYSEPWEWWIPKHQRQQKVNYVSDKFTSHVYREEEAQQDFLMIKILAILICFLQEKVMTYFLFLFMITKVFLLIYSWDVRNILSISWTLNYTKSGIDGCRLALNWPFESLLLFLSDVA